MFAHSHSLTVRRAFTLLELLLTLALVVLIAGMAWPALSHAFDGQKLRRSADLFRADLARARNEAMKSGQIVMFRAVLATSRYELRPFALRDDQPESASESPPVNSSQNTSPASSAPSELAANIVFESVTTRDSHRSDQAAASTDRAPAVNENWSPPLLFYADGTCSSSTITLRNDRRDFLSLEIRGLTGAVRSGELQSNPGGEQTRE